MKTVLITLFSMLSLSLFSQIAEDSLPQKKKIIVLDGERIHLDTIQKTKVLLDSTHTPVISRFTGIDSLRQIDSTVLIPAKPLPQVSVLEWAYKRTLGLLMTQTAFVNWNAGGENSIAGIASFDFEFNYKRNRMFWTNYVKARFGLNKENGQSTRKTDDVIEYTSNFGYRQTETSNWYTSARFNFRTQFAHGYKYPDRENYISKFFAPAYVFLGAGSQYTSDDKRLKLYLSPITNKTTLVYDKRLSDEGAFGVTPGSFSKVEFGILTTGEWHQTLMRNVVMDNKLILYTDYLNDFSNIDVDWELKIDLIVNKFVKANVGTHVIFDNDVIDSQTNRPEIQLKQVLGVGVVYSL